MFGLLRHFSFGNVDVESCLYLFLVIRIQTQFESLKKALICGDRLGWVICVQKPQNTQLFRRTFLLSLGDLTQLILHLYLVLGGIDCCLLKELVDLLISGEKV